MNIPNLPRMDTPLTINSQDGRGTIHPDWYKYFSQMTNELQINQSEEGTQIPKQNTANIAKIQANVFTPRFVYNETTQKPMVWVNGAFENITTAAP